MIDFHCHLDLYENSISLLPIVKARCKFVFAVTTSPRAWVKTSQVFSGVDCISVALGFHPELLADRNKEQESFLLSIPKSRFIGEIGLDGTTRSKGSLGLQIEFFREAIKQAEASGGRIMSIHSRSAVKPTLDIIESATKTSVLILHWFTGTEKELDRALSLSCWFSINPLMLTSKRGIALIRRVPLPRMLPETDGPFTTHGGIPYTPWETSLVVEGIARIKGMSTDAVFIAMLENLVTLGIETR